MSQITRFRLIWIAGLVLSGCVHREPEQPLSMPDPLESLSKIKNESFKFRLNFSKPGIRGKFAGQRMKKPERIRITGSWFIDGKEERLNKIGIGEYDYTRKDAKWVKLPRSRETNPISLLKIVTSINDFKYLKLEGGNFVYSFTPNLLFMSPEAENVEGYVYIDKLSHLPKRVTAYSKDRKIQWQFVIERYDPNIYIKNPLARRYEVYLSISGKNVEKTLEVIEKRVKNAGLENPMIDRKGMVLSFRGEGGKEELIRGLLKKGELSIFTATYPKRPVYEIKDKNLVFVGGKKSYPMLLNRKLNVKIQNISIIEKSLGSERLKVKIENEIISAQPIVIMVDGTAACAFPKFRGKKLEMPGGMALWARLSTGPLSCEVKILEIRMKDEL